jgi:hypothetical protein
MTAASSVRADSILAAIALGVGIVAFGVALTAGFFELHDDGSSFASASFDLAMRSAELAVVVTAIAIVFSALVFGARRSRLSTAALTVSIGALPLAFVIFAIGSLSQ